MSTDLATTTVATNVTIDPELVMKALKLDPRDANTHALLLVCERYGLDPLLKHMVLIQGNPYVTRDGYLAVAHASRKFDGMTVDETGETQTHYTAKVSVYRTDMTRPFTYVGRFPKSKSMAKEYGPEMAVKVAEVQALRRAFNVTGVAAADERWDTDDDQAPALPPAGHAQAEGGSLAALTTGEAQPVFPRAPAAPPSDPFDDFVSEGWLTAFEDRCAEGGLDAAEVAEVVVAGTGDPKRALPSQVHKGESAAVKAALMVALSAPAEASA